MVLKRQYAADRGLRTRSYPPAGKLPVLIDDWLGLAPLASPETLSESSSLASYGSSVPVSGLGYQRVMSSILPPRMDPILQSPARSSNSRDCGLYLESADVVGDLATLSPCVENLPSPLAPYHHNPDIVPVPPSVIDDSSSTGAGCVSSPDVVQETRSASNAVDLCSCKHHYDTCHMPSVHCRHSTDQHIVSTSCEHGACACGIVQPDIVCTHDYST